ncbi:response regulator transcription factor [Cohnella luojiensis]|uniref:Response regulator n=1 Tax=Cohnella luojiensis TaxID=652876 RepID=A0A4Y8M2J8_9BACL|nr:response regulator [Cohnella luojiensis]TFE26905.1 response regulator [Cohnella luojiensis]
MLKVITVDDEKAVKQGLRKIIELHCPGFEVVGEAEDGLEALELVRLHNPHVVITDITMPVMNGIELIARIREWSAATELIVMSGYDDFKYAQEALRYGVKDYLLKPMKIESVSKLLNGLREENVRRSAELERYRSCLWACTGIVEKLAEQLWLLDEAGWNGSLTAISERIGGDLLTDDEKALLYADLTAYLRRQIRERGLELEDVAPTERGSEDLFVRNVDHAADVIRANRNWGQRVAIRNALNHIHERYHDPELSLEEVIALVNVSPAYFYKMFKEETGRNFKTYLIEFRLDKARELLAGGQYKTYEIAERIGYPDYPHFTKVFKKYVGLSPSEFRKNMGIF